MRNGIASLIIAVAVVSVLGGAFSLGKTEASPMDSLRAERQIIYNETGKTVLVTPAASGSGPITSAEGYSFKAVYEDGSEKMLETLDCKCFEGDPNRYLVSLSDDEGLLEEVIVSWEKRGGTSVSEAWYPTIEQLKE